MFFDYTNEQLIQMAEELNADWIAESSEWRRLHKENNPDSNFALALVGLCVPFSLELAKRLKEGK